MLFSGAVQYGIFSGHSRCVPEGRQAIKQVSTVIDQFGVMLCRIVIIGGGVIGAATAYYLSLRGVGATVVERSAIACAASGNESLVVKNKGMVSSYTYRIIKRCHVTLPTIFKAAFNTEK